MDDTALAFADTLPMALPAEADSALVTPALALAPRFTLPPVAAATAGDGQSEARQGFRIGGLGLMVRYEDASALTEMPQVFRLPNAPAWFLGMANLHGALTPVFDLAPYLGLEPASHARRMLLVLSHGADAAGVVIDGLPHRLRFSAQDAMAQAVVPGALQHCVGATYRVAGSDWMDLRQAALLERLVEQLAA